MEFKFIHAADIHLDSPLHGLERYQGVPVDEFRGATRRAFLNLIELAIAEQVGFVLLAGDLYDGDWKDYNTGLFFVQCMGRLHKAGIRVFAVSGNHDAASQITRYLRLPDNVKIFSSKRPERVLLDEFGVAIHGQGFARRAVTEDLSLGYPQGDPHYFNIGVLHTCLEGKPGHAPYAPCSVDGLRSKGYDYWALGHVHLREEVSRDPWILFPGNIQGRHIRETGAKGCTLVRVENGEVAAVEPRDLDVVRWSLCRLDLTCAADTDEVYQLVQDALRSEVDGSGGRPVALRLELHGSCAAHTELHAQRERWEQEYRALASTIAGAGLWLERVIINTSTRLSGQDLAARQDALGGLLHAISELQLDASALKVHAAEFSELRRKLPVELLSGEDPFDPTDPDLLKAALGDVKELLLHRLLSSERTA